MKMSTILGEVMKYVKIQINIGTKEEEKPAEATKPAEPVKEDPEIRMPKKHYPRRGKPHRKYADGERRKKN